MRDQAVQVLIRVIPVLVLLLSILLPFMANGWDIYATIVPANPFLKIGTGFLPGIGGGTGGSTGAGRELPRQGPLFSIPGSGLSQDGSRVFLDVMMGNPFPVPFDIKQFTGSMPVGGTVVNLALVQPVSIPSGGSARVRLEAPRPQGLRPGGSTLPAGQMLSDLKMTLSVLGMEMTLDENTIRGMAS